MPGCQGGVTRVKAGQVQGGGGCCMFRDYEPLIMANFPTAAAREWTCSFP